MYMYHVHEETHRDQARYQVPGSHSYRWLQAAMWVLRLDSLQ